MNASLVKELRELTGAGMLDCKKALDATEGNIEASVDWLREKGMSKAAKKSSRTAAEGLASVLIEGNKAVILEVNSETDFVAKNEKFTSLVDTLGKILLDSNVETIEEALTLPTEEGTVKDLVISKTAQIGEKLDLRRFVKVEKTDSQAFGSYLHMGGKIAVLITVDGASDEVAKEVAMHAAAMRPLYLESSLVPTDVLDKEKEIMKEQLLNEGKPVDKVDMILNGKVKKYYSDVCLKNQIFVKAENKETVEQYVKNNNGTIVSMTRFEVGDGIEKVEENFADEVAKQISNV